MALRRGLAGLAEVSSGLRVSWKLEKNAVLRLSSAVPSKYCTIERIRSSHKDDAVVPRTPVWVSMLGQFLAAEAQQVCWALNKGQSSSLLQVKRDMSDEDFSQE